MKIINDNAPERRLFVISTPRGWCIVRENGFQVSGFFEHESTAGKMAEVFSLLFDAKFAPRAMQRNFE